MMVDNHAVDKAQTAIFWLDRLGITELLSEDGVTEVMINRPFEIWVEGSNGLIKHDKPELTYDSCYALALALATYNDKKIDLKKPIDSVTLPDGERCQIMLPPASEQGTIIFCIRKPSTSRFALNDYIKTGRLSGSALVGLSDKITSETITEDSLKPFEQRMLAYYKEDDFDGFFKEAIQNKLNICMVGGTGSGKTTFTKAIADLVPSDTRIITIEDTHELDLPNHPNHLHLFYKEHITAKQVIASCMRLKPDRIFLTELRGDEAWDYLSALNTGHAGGLTSVHANDATSVFYRIAQLAKESATGQSMDYNYILNTVRSTIDVVCFFEKTKLKELYYNPIDKRLALLGR